MTVTNERKRLTNAELKQLGEALAWQEASGVDVGPMSRLLAIETEKTAASDDDTTESA